MSAPPAPGWYPDPHDPAFLRFFDGRSWTTGRAPAFPDEIPGAAGAAGEDGEDGPTASGTEDRAPTGDPTASGTEDRAPTGDPTASGTEDRAPTGDPTASGTEDGAATTGPTGSAADQPAATTDPTGSGTEDGALAGDRAPADPDDRPPGDPAPAITAVDDPAPEGVTPDDSGPDDTRPGDTRPEGVTPDDSGPDDTRPGTAGGERGPGDTGGAGASGHQDGGSSRPADRGTGQVGEALAGTLHLTRPGASVPAAPPPGATEPLTVPGTATAEHAALATGPGDHPPATAAGPAVPEPPRLDDSPSDRPGPVAGPASGTAGGWASTPPPPPPPPGSGPFPTEPFTPHRVIHLPNATIHTTTVRPPGRGRLLVGGGLVAAALVVIGALFVLRDSAPDLEWQGRDIEEPGETLAQAESILEALVDERHGALHDDSRCYFGVPEGQSDQVDDRLRCGPVLFVDGDPDEPYLSFPLTASDAGAGVRLTVGDEPVDPDPAAVAADVELIRHDGKRPPSGAGGLEPPEPPPAADDLVDAVDLGTVTLGTPPEGAAIGSLNASYELTGLATVDRFGTGDEARRAPEGHQLIAFELTAGPGESPLATGAPTVAVQIDDGSPRDITAFAGSGGTIVVAAPEDAESVDLVVTDADVEQRLSLLDGTPAPGNLRVLTRANRSQQIGAVHQVTATGTDGAGSVPVTGTINVESVHLDWFLREDPSKRAANGDVALLVVTLSYNWVDITPPDAGLAEQAFTLAVPDGRTLPAFNLAPDPVNSIIVAFEVPADFTTGTLNIGGVVPQPGGVTIDFGASVYPTAVSIPAG